MKQYLEIKGVLFKATKFTTNSFSYYHENALIIWSFPNNLCNFKIPPINTFFKSKSFALYMPKTIFRYTRYELRIPAKDCLRIRKLFQLRKYEFIVRNDSEILLRRRSLRTLYDKKHHSLCETWEETSFITTQLSRQMSLMKQYLEIIRLMEDRITHYLKIRLCLVTFFFNLYLFRWIEININLG